MLVNCLDVSYATLIPTIVSLVLPLAASGVRKCPMLAENSGFYENIAVRMARNASKYPRRLQSWPKVLVNCSDMSYVTFIPAIVASVSPFPTSRMQNVQFSPKTAVFMKI